MYSLWDGQGTGNRKKMHFYRKGIYFRLLKALIQWKQLQERKVIRAG
ncbi:hypothetical protein KNP414_05875 [Paenibacillus mucilaginosus KNP414]|uniref:Uncharacterized protein n=1 Tax=Paenibacillus mucilaginosus (strain KNP414) TaxID=1036673 RepID=F8F9S0_PAEMK|nr:hypothetical protein KNP414_05875 [Paenibacillus mucilaginosus KNP414]